MFAEEPGLLKYMSENGTCEEITVADFEIGNWASSIERVAKAQDGKKFVEVVEGSEQVAKTIEGLIKRGV